MQTLRTLKALERERLVTPDARAGGGCRSMAIALTPEMLALIDRSDPARSDRPPVRAQRRRDRDSADELADPIGDERARRSKGIVHRYPDRVLLKPLHVCPVYCRFCFRREKVGPGGEALSADELDAALAYIRARPEIWEVILTGGDPLMLSPRRLAELIAALDAIAHVGVIRIHTPRADRRSRAGDRRAGRGAEVAPRRLWFAVHCNHARELDAAARAAWRGWPMPAFR